MTRTSPNSQPLLHGLALVSLIIPLVQAQCNTDQNPYCHGNNKFEQICCPYPNICYWANRQGDPACCPAGQMCIDGGGAAVTVPTQPTPAPIYSTVTSKPQDLSTITSYVTHPTPTTTAGGGGVVVVTNTNEPGCDVCSTVTSGAAGALSTVTSNVAGGFSTVTSDIAGAYSTVTSGFVSVATDAATGIVQVINAAPLSGRGCCQIVFGIGLGAALWQFI